MYKLLPLALLSFSLLARGQETGIPTQVLVTVDSKDAPTILAKDLTFEVNGHKQVPTSLTAVRPAGAQIALLIDDGLRTSFGRELETLRSFVGNLPAGTEVFIGYMSNGRVQQASYFTTDHAAAASKVRIPMGMAGVSASPYFCLSEFVKNWPREGFDNGAAAAKARFVLMVTNGVDPYNGSTSPLNQDSPYVQTAVRDAQRAGVSVSSIYFSDQGFRGGQASFSGQSYLSQVAEGTGGRAFYQGMGNPVSLQPYLDSFKGDVAESYIATVNAGGRDLVQVKVKSTVPHLKVRAAQQVLAGNVETAGAQ